MKLQVYGNNERIKLLIIIVMIIIKYTNIVNAFISAVSQRIRNLGS